MSSWLVLQRRFLALQHIHARPTITMKPRAGHVDIASHQSDFYLVPHHRKRRARTYWKPKNPLMQGSRQGICPSSTLSPRYQHTFQSVRCFATEAILDDTSLPEENPPLATDNHQDHSKGTDPSTFVKHRPLFDHSSKSYNASAQLKMFLEREGFFHLFTKNAFRRIRVMYETDQSSLKKVAWTAIFTCPVTNVKVPSGTLRGQQTIDSSYVEKTENVDEATVVYANWKMARHAAAGAYLDGIQHAAIGRIEPRFCQERPRTIDIPVSEKVAARTLKSPLARLIKEFPLFYNRVYEPDALTSVSRVVAEDVSWEGNADEAVKSPIRNLDLWSAVITCPVTGTEFPSSILLNNSKQRYCQRDGIIYHAQKKEAIQSAAARFLDAMEYHKLGPDNYNASNRHCKEDAAILGLKLGSVQIVDAVKSEVQMSNCEPLTIVSTTVPSPPIDTNIENEQEEDSSSDEEEDEVELQLMMDEPTAMNYTAIGELLNHEDYVVTDISEFDDNQRPVDRLRAVVNSSLGLSSTGTASKIIADQQAVLDEAMLFASTLLNDLEKRQPTSIHRVKVGSEDAELRLIQAKRMLSLIGDAVCAAPVGGKTLGARNVANKILSLLWKTKDGRPDADTYALYIRCNDDRLPRDSIYSTVKLIHAMNSGKNVPDSSLKLPKANINTLNAFIQLNAQQGGTRGRYAEHTDTLEPNRQSFLAVLSSAIYESIEETDPSGFDPDFAADCIGRMEELYEETQDKSLQPDTQVYNAPLRWTGGPLLWVSSRRYARSVPWDDYRMIYSRGLREQYHDDDLRIQEAEKVAAWIEKMKSMANQGQPTKPDIETYEALIQSWLRTVTRKGLDEADRVFHELVDSGDDTLKIRLQTMHPLLASWFHSNETDRWSKISHIIERWEILSGEHRAIDPRIMELKIAALMGKVDKEAKTQQETLGAAKETTSLVLSFTSLSNKNKSSHYVVERALNSWEDVAEMNDGSLNNEILTNVEAILNSYEDIARRATSSILTATDRPTSEGEDAVRLQNICKSSPLVYGSLVRVLTKVNQNSLSAYDDRRVSALFSRTTRSLGELTAILHQLTTSNLLKDARQTTFHTYEDRFSYRLRDLQEIPHPMSMLWNMITYFGNKIVQGSTTNDEVQSLAVIYHCLAGSKTANRLRSQIAYSLDQAYPGMADRLKSFYKAERVHLLNPETDRDVENDSSNLPNTNRSQGRSHSNGSNRRSHRKKRATNKASS